MSYNMQEATSFAKKHNLNLTQLVTMVIKTGLHIYTYIIKTTVAASYQASPSSHPPIPYPTAESHDVACFREAAQSLKSRPAPRVFFDEEEVHLRPEISYMKTSLKLTANAADHKFNMEKSISAVQWLDTLWFDQNKILSMHKEIKSFNKTTKTGKP